MSAVRVAPDVRYGLYIPPRWEPRDHHPLVLKHRLAEGIYR